MSFNPLQHPICYAYPRRLGVSSWTGHVPFAMYLIDILRPRLLVELGTHYGISYCAFCQAVDELHLDTKCYAIDTWTGDPQTSFYGPEVLTDLKEHHDPIYSRFSRLVESTFDEAVGHFQDGTVDLLHIDGYHTLGEVNHDFETWLPKLSRRGVMLLHDINVRERQFGVWNLWQELTSRYPHFEFIHTHGLGVLAVGDQSAELLQDLLGASTEDQRQIREFFSQLGRRLEVAQELRRVTDSARQEFGQKESEIASLIQQSQLSAQEIERQKAELASYAETIDQLRETIDQLRGTVDQLGRTIDELRVKEQRLDAILGSNAWRWVSRYGRFKNRFKFASRTNNSRE